jgi:holin family protein
MKVINQIEFILFLPVFIYKKGGMIGALAVSFLTASMFTPYWKFVNTYIYNDWEFLKYFAVAISVDLVSGVVKNWFTKSICWEDGLVKFARKLFTCLGILVMFHVFVHFEDGAASQFAKEYLDMIKRLMILSFIGLSAITNIYEISGGKFPPLWLISRLKDFDDKGKRVEPGEVERTTTSVKVKEETVVVKKSQTN